jgi:hypothetical protein
MLLVECCCCCCFIVLALLIISVFCWSKCVSFWADFSFFQICYYHHNFCSCVQLVLDTTASSNSKLTIVIITFWNIRTSIFRLFLPFANLPRVGTCAEVWGENLLLSLLKHDVKIVQLRCSPRGSLPNCALIFKRASKEKMCKSKSKMCAN